YRIVTGVQTCALPILVLVGPAPGGQGWGPAPFLAALRTVGAGGAWSVVITVGVVAAGGGALLALIAGISRTALAMARERDLPPRSEERRVGKECLCSV